MDPLTELDRLIRLHVDGNISGCELEGKVLQYLWKLPEQKDAVLKSLSNHADKSVRRVAGCVADLLRKCEEQIKDIDQIRRTSPLHPGTRLTLAGGYTGVVQCQADGKWYRAPWWLNGRQCYQGTFLAFAERGAGIVPAALVALDDEIDLTEGGGLRHKGRYALLTLLYVANWTEKGTVTVHVVEALPGDVEAFYSSHPFGTEIETHATYTLVNSDQESGRSKR